MNQQTTPGQPKWHVIGQQETNRTDAGGKFVSGVLVQYQTDTGVQGAVFVPDAQYTPSMVKQLIDARYTQHKLVSQLTG